VLTRWFVYFLKLMTSYQENKQLNTTGSLLSVDCRPICNIFVIRWEISVVKTGKITLYRVSIATQTKTSTSWYDVMHDDEPKNNYTKIPLNVHFLQHAQCSHCKRCTSYSNSVCLSVCLSVCPSVTRRYCVKTTARSTVQFALLDSKMCLVL